MHQLPPHNLEAEKCVIGSILIDKEAIVNVADFLLPEDFYPTAHQLILKAIIDLYKERSPIDLVTLTDYLEKRSQLALVGGVSYIAALCKEVPTSSHIKRYADIVKEKSRRRQSHQLLNKLKDALGDEVRETKDIIKEVVGDLVSIVEDKKYNTGKAVDILQDLVGDWEVVAKGGFGLSTGIDTLDKAVKGYRDGHYWLVMADTNIGKTSFAIMMLHHFLQKNPKECVVFFSSEMTHKEMTEKIVAKEADLEVYDLPTNMGDQKVIEAVEKVSGMNLFVFDDCRTAANMQLKIEYLKLRGYVPKLVFVDYIQNLSGPGQGVTEKLERISAELQGLAISQKFCLVVMSQIPKAEKGVHPYAVNPMGSSQIKNQSGVALLLRREIEEEEKIENETGVKVFQADAIMTKNRYGERRNFHPYIDKAKGHYYPKKPVGVLIAGSKTESRTFETAEEDFWLSN